MAERAGTVVVGVGNPGRGDDGVGPAVARALQGRVGPGVRVVARGGEPAGLVALLEAAEAVALVDAVRGEGPAGRVWRFEAGAGPLPARLFGRTSTHAMGLAEAVELARALGALPGRVVVFGVEGQGFGVGEGLSPAVAAAVPEVAARVLDELGRWRRG